MRVGAWLIDWVIASVVSAIVLVPLHAVHQSASGANRSLLSGVTVTNQGAILSILIVLIYSTALIGSRRGQSLGMMVARVKAVDAGAGTSIGYGRALGRAVVEYLLFVILIVPWVLDMLFPLWDARRQTLHDKLTNTVVVTARSRRDGHLPRLRRDARRHGVVDMPRGRTRLRRFSNSPCRT